MTASRRAVQGSLAGWLLTVVVATAPLMEGGTTPRAVFMLTTATGIAAFFWVVELLRQRRAPDLSWKATGVFAALMIQGAIMVGNARGYYDAEFRTLAGLTPAVSWLPQAIDRGAGMETMRRLGALFLLWMMSSDLCAERRWVRRLVGAMALGGSATALVGMIQKAAPGTIPIWGTRTLPPHVFGTFWYHANAAALMNMTWPLTLTLAGRAFRPFRGQFFKAVWVGSTLAVGMALAVNISKAGHAIALILAAVPIALLSRQLGPLIRTRGWAPLLAAAAALAVAFGLLAASGGASYSLARWQEFLKRDAPDSRLMVARICLQMLPAGGAFGYGPGSFLAAFQEHLAAQGTQLSAIWKFAHNDWLQYGVEWGFVGGALWFGFWSLPLRQACGALAALFVGTRRHPVSSRYPKADPAAMGSYFHHRSGVSLAFVGIMIHAAMDFPLQILSLQMYALSLAGILLAHRDERPR